MEGLNVTDEKELHELRELEQRIAKLRFHEQLYLFERILTEHRRQREETVAWIASSTAAFLELEKRQREADSSVSISPEAKREAG
jgi:hypothetical protein